MSRPYKVHYVASGRTLCTTPLQYNAHPDRTTPYMGETTCLRCLYHLGRYMPLSKLREHQSEQSWGRAAYGKRDPFYAPPPHCLGCGRLLVKMSNGLLLCPVWLTHNVSCCS